MASQGLKLEDFASEQTFRIIIWFGLGLCVVSFALRLTIRIICFQRLFAEDYLMILALTIIASITGVLHTYLNDIYIIIEPPEAAGLPLEDYSNAITIAWRADGVAIILSAVGTWTIKINFMLFFFRFGHQIRAYKILWWVALTVIVACGAVLLGIIPYGCVFNDSTWVNTNCITTSRMRYIYSVYQANVALDVVSDLIIIFFPIVILWNTKISLRQKFVLSGIFSLVAFTIAITVVRGTIFFDVYRSGQDAERKGMDPSSMVFWFFIELIVSFVVACLVSFRSLWTNKRQDNKKRRIRLEGERIMTSGQQKRGPMRSFAALKRSNVMRNRWNGLLDTLADLEGTTLGRNAPKHILPPIPSGRVTDDLYSFETLHRDASAVGASNSSNGIRDFSADGYSSPVRGKWANEPQGLVEQCRLIHHAEPLPSYHRPGTAV